MERKLAIPAFITIRDKGGPQQETLTLRKVLEERDVTRYPEQQKVKEQILAFLTAHGH